MTSPTPAGFLDFFVLEASEYVEQLDGLLLAGGQGMPDGDAMLRTARALRGSATMAKLTPFADLAAALERVTRGLREGGVPWSPALRGVLVAAIDDLKILVRAARGWSGDDTQRAAARAAELLGHAPAASAARPTPAGGSNLEFLARETGNIAAGIELLLTARPDRATAGNVLQRVRAMRGIAALRDVPGLSPVLEGAEEGLAPMERADGLPSQPQRELLQAVVSILRDAGASLRNGQLPAIEGAPLVFLERALDAWQESAAAAEVIVPVSALFPADGNGVVSESSTPPTTPDARFRLELVGHGEHLQRIVSEARGNADPTARERVRRVIRQALRATRALAESFGRTGVANSISDVADMATVFDERALSLLGEVAGVLSRAATGGGEEQVEPALASAVARHREMGAGTPTPAAPVAAVPAVPFPPLAAPTPIPAPAAIAPPPQALAVPAQAPAPASAPVPTPQYGGFTPSSAPTPIMPMTAIPAAPVAPPPVAAAPAPAPASPPPVPHTTPAPRTSGRTALGSLLAQSAASVEALADHPLAAPAPMPEQPIVPVESLVYRGRAALRRAIELRDEMRAAANPPARESLEELFDLLDLALVAD